MHIHRLIYCPYLLPLLILAASPVADAQSIAEMLGKSKIEEINATMRAKAEELRQEEERLRESGDLSPVSGHVLPVTRVEGSDTNLPPEWNAFKRKVESRVRRSERIGEMMQRCSDSNYKDCDSLLR